MPHLTRAQFVERFKSIKLLALDVDGVLTDDSLYFGPDGFEMKRFNVSDGFYMVLSMRAGLELAIISGRYSAATDSRMKDLGVKHVLQGKKKKDEHIQPLLTELALDFSDIAFVGNEILDIGLAKRAGLSIAVADSARELIDVVDFVTLKNGGSGAVREVVEAYFEATNQNPLDLIP